MKTVTQKFLIAVAMVVGMAIGSGAVSVSAATQNEFLARDGGGSTPVVVAGVTNLETVHQSRHGIGFLAD
jgi:hypothetical protein